METKKLVYNNEQYSILTSIKLSQTAFLICIDSLDKKIIYFKQEVVDGKVKLTSPANILPNASEVNKKSLSNKKRIIDAFIPKVQLGLSDALFVDHNKVSEAFHNLTKEIDNCDLKYYMIENASIEETDEQIENLMIKFNGLNFSKDLEQVKELKNELYYYTEEEEEVKPKEEGVSNVNRLEVEVPSQSNNNVNETPHVGPSIASDPFQAGGVNLDAIADGLNGNNSIDEALNKHLEQYAPKKDDVEISPEKQKKAKMIKTILIVVVSLAIIAFVYFTMFNKTKVYSTSEIMEKVNAKVKIKEIDEGVNYNAPDDMSTNYQKVLKNKLINVNIASLKSLNKDTIGWIQNDFLKINYPIVKGKTNSYYTTHNYLDGESEGGWIYLDAQTDLLNIDQNNVIYGKSNISEEFFYSLRRVLTVDFAQDVNNQVIKISTEDADTLWLVFSVYETPNEEYFLTNDFKDKTEYLEFINTITKRSIHDFDVDLDEYDKILTLTTNKDNDNRIVVHAKLIKINSRIEEETKEEKKEEPKLEEETKTDVETKETPEEETQKGEEKGEN